MRRCTTVISSDLLSNHRQRKKNPFLFLRGSFYRWAQPWSLICSELCNAPQVLVVGDLHVNSFGTWRDLEGRLCWGVDDFDESYWLPYTNDLVCLTASMKIVADAEGPASRLRQPRPAKICDDRRLTRRLCGPGGQSDAAVRLRVGDWRCRASPF